MTDFNARPPHHLRDRIAAYEFSLDVKWQRRFTSEACTVKKGKKVSHAPSAQVTLSLRFHARLTRRDTEAMVDGIRLTVEYRDYGITVVDPVANARVAFT